MSTQCFFSSLPTLCLAVCLYWWRGGQHQRSYRPGQEKFRLPQVELQIFRMPQKDTQSVLIVFVLCCVQGVSPLGLEREPARLSSMDWLKKEEATPSSSRGLTGCSQKWDPCETQKHQSAEGCECRTVLHRSATTEPEEFLFRHIADAAAAFWGTTSNFGGGSIFTLFFIWASARKRRKLAS